ncbi:hypothetical protein HDF24_14660 [Mucilaginibacter sp. X4EP1]|uniref:hypothetical protein n=1 Tax=Mucilaginibacter sp. X4EP1 TaxID=2723092 RepID=UPI0021683CE8|nr:hypothetical protein [Mucilaginibacter sp. X4EP1]MCS3815466.1 hypothetical protein [Mucilaginibacter sp. X4EP1]
MIKTEYQAPYLKRIDALNDQLWYFLFTSEELNRKLSSFSNKAKEAYTTDLFHDNQFSQRLYVKAIDLQAHQDQNKLITFGAYLSTCYEITTNYIKDIFDKLKTINGLTYVWSDTEPEKKLKSLYTTSGLVFTPEYLLKTLTYIRLRRNHFTHLILTPNSKLTGFISANGNALNAQWRTTGVVSSIDFTSTTNVAEFQQDEAIELIKLIRICIIAIDQFVGSTLDKNGFITSIVKKEYGHLKTRRNSLIIDERKKKIVNIAKAKFDLIVTESEVEPFVNTIGMR